MDHREGEHHPQRARYREHDERERMPAHASSRDQPLGEAVADNATEELTGRLQQRQQQHHLRRAL